MPQFLPSPALAVRNWEISALKSVCVSSLRELAKRHDWHR
jgi:hypothetical protein